jgi:hypothetical protein
MRTGSACAHLEGHETTGALVPGRRQVTPSPIWSEVSSGRQRCRIIRTTMLITVISTITAAV